VVSYILIASQINGGKPIYIVQHSLAILSFLPTVLCVPILSFLPTFLHNVACLFTRVSMFRTALCYDLHVTIKHVDFDLTSIRVLPRF